MNGARDSILQRLATGQLPPKPRLPFTLPAWTEDTAAHFIQKAKASIAKVHEIGSEDDAPECIFAIMSGAGLAPVVHIPKQSALLALPWHRAPGLMLSNEAPNGEDTAFSAGDFGIAETGTLVCLSGPRSHSSWHFRPGREILLLQRAAILPRFEDVIRVLASKPLPATVNLITGPSRTADIEQMIELGAHGPRESHILIAG